MNTITNSDTMLSLTVAFFSAALVGVLIAMKNKVLTFKEGYQVFIDGFQQMIEAILILIFAWCIGGVTSDVGAADYIVEATRGFMTPGIMFISLFITACITSLQRVPVGVLSPFSCQLPFRWHWPMTFLSIRQLEPAWQAACSATIVHRSVIRRFWHPWEHPVIISPM